MSAPGRSIEIEVILRLARDTTIIEGSLVTQGGEETAFFGWIELFVLLDRTCTGSRSPLVRLTTTELKVASLVGEGLTNPEIAQRLTLSTRTVQGHLYRVFKKLKVRTRTELARELIRLSVGDAEDRRDGAQLESQMESSGSREPGPARRTSPSRSRRRDR